VTRERIRNRGISETVARLLAPFAPHLAEELWEALGRERIFDSGWPDFDEAALVRREVEYVIQVNGKLRGRLSLPAGLPPEEVDPLVMADPQVARWLEGKTVVKRVHVPDKLVNLVVK
jgi:leucyl-tRNA synthetase